MNRHQRAWAALILGIIAGYAALALLFSAEGKRETLSLFALLFASGGLWFSLNARRRCTRQTDRR